MKPNNRILITFRKYYLKSYRHIQNYGVIDAWLLFSIGFLLIVFCSCSTKKTVTENTKTTIEYRDRTVMKDTTIYVDVPHEVIKEVVPVFDTLRISSTTADFMAYVDSCSQTLKGAVKSKEISLKSNVSIPERVIEKDSIVYQTKEVPVEVVKEKAFLPKVFWWILSYAILSGAFFIWRFIVMLKGKGVLSFIKGLF